MSKATISIKPGLLNLTGSTPAALHATQKTLREDYEKHHCYFRNAGLHNHLSHHILAAYDLGASAELIEAIYADEAKIQRTIVLEGENEKGADRGKIDAGNWKEFLDDQRNYAAFVTFFTEQALKHGVTETINKYIFSEEANAPGIDMLVRLMAGAIHPFIQLGYALEFGSDPLLVAEALAQAAIHSTGAGQVECYKYIPPASNSGNLFHVINELYASDTLAPILPYDPDAFFNERRDKHFGPGTKRSAELARVCSLWEFPDNKESLNDIVEQAFWAVTLLFASTGKAGREPRLDFFLMHGVTSALFLPAYLKAIPSLENQIRLVRHWWVANAVIAILRGRPRIDGSLVMTYTDTPLPPAFANVMPQADKSALGNPISAINPWTFIINSALRASDAHVMKTIRSLIYAAQKYGQKGASDIPGALGKDGKEVVKGLKLVDGTIFIRTAGIVIKALGWVDWGEKEGAWDRSALGWDDAWKE